MALNIATPTPKPAATQAKKEIKSVIIKHKMPVHIAYRELKPNTVYSALYAGNAGEYRHPVVVKTGEWNDIHNSVHLTVADLSKGEVLKGYPADFYYLDVLRMIPELNHVEGKVLIPELLTEHLGR